MLGIPKPAPAWAERLTSQVNLPFPRTYFAMGNTPIVVRLKAKLESLGPPRINHPRLWKFTPNRDQASLRPCPLARSRWAHLRGLGFGKPSEAQPSACCMHRMDWMISNVPPLNRCSLISCKKRPRGRRMATPQNDSRLNGSNQYLTPQPQDRVLDGLGSSPFLMAFTALRTKFSRPACSENAPS